MRHVYDLRLTSKFFLLGLVSVLMLALPVFLYFQDVLKEGAHVRRINDSHHTVVALNGMIKVIQTLRGVSAAGLSGDRELAGRRAGAQKAVAESINAMDAELRELGMSAELQRQWAEIKRDWNELNQMLDQQTMTSAQNIQAHTQLIRKAFQANDQLLAEHGFSLDSHPDTHSLIQAALVMAPKISEAFGLMRAQGSSYLAQGAISAEEVGILRNAVHSARQLDEDIVNGLSRIASTNPALHEALSATVQETRSQVLNAFELIEEELINARRLQYPASWYFDSITHTIDTLHTFNTVALAQLTSILAQRVQASNDRIVRTSLALLAGLIAALAVTVAIMRSITRPVNQAIHVAEAVAQGDLTVSVPVQGTNEFAALMAQMENMRQNLIQLVAQMTDSARNVASESLTMAHSNEELSSRTISQAAALEETAASMEQLTVTVRHNADRAKRANGLSESAADVAGKSNAVVDELAHTMGDINASAKQIVDIIAVIDGIAFQTNILALNASVEAARAGAQGRGFAVVATEVRALAQRSASAAKEIKDLIDASVEAIGKGYRLATEAGASMEQTVTSIRDVTEIVGEITLASQEQSLGIEQINEAVSQMDEATQQNAHLVEQTANAARSLQQQATDLEQLVSTFRIDPTIVDVTDAIEINVIPANEPDLLRIGSMASQ